MSAIIVTGGTGFLGAHVVRALLRRGETVYALRRNSPTPPPPGTEEARWFNGELHALPVTSEWNASTLIHLAAYGVTEKAASWEQCFRVNVSDAIAAWSRAFEQGVRRFVICGSCFEYGRAAERYSRVPTDAPLEPIGPYASSKAAASVAAEAFARSLPVEVTLLRPFHVYGEGEKAPRFWPSLREAALTGRDFHMTAGEQVRDFIEVRRAASFFVSAATDARERASFNVAHVATGVPQSLRSFAEHWWTTWRAKGSLVFGSVAYREAEVMRYVG